jgi:hypothetical protein
MQTDLDAEMAIQQASFALRFNAAVWFLTTGLQFFIGWWYRRQAVFYLPKGWFGPAEWWLALPFAPKGTSTLFNACPPSDLIVDPCASQDLLAVQRGRWHAERQLKALRQ